MRTNIALEKNSSEHTLCSHYLENNNFREDCRNFNILECGSRQDGICRTSYIKGAKDLLEKLVITLRGYDNGLDNIDLTNNFEKKRDNLLSLNEDELRKVISLNKDDVNKRLLLDEDQIKNYEKLTQEQREVALKAAEQRFKGGRRRRKGTKKRKKNKKSRKTKRRKSRRRRI